MKEAKKRRREQTESLAFSVGQQYHDIGINREYHIQTYGCQGNEADSEAISGILKNLGFTEATDINNADLIILNTCAIRETAENRIWGVLGNLKALKRANKDLIIAICGCMPQEEKTIDYILSKYRIVDLIFGTHNIYKLPEYLFEAFKHKQRVIEVMSIDGKIVEAMPKNRASQHKAWVNIMYGCDEFCTYCIVPYTRGKERSRNPEDILQEVRALVNLGYLEITLLGQNVNAYGKDLEQDYTFAELLQELNRTGISRIRFTTSHPRDLDDATIACFSTCETLMPALHLPVQSGSNRILKQMNRKYTKEDYLNLIRKLREARPDISITTDIIVGFPGETEEDFLETLNLVEQADFEGAFTFVFSPREGTPAANMADELSAEEKHERLLRLNERVNAGYLKGHQRFEGEYVLVLVDSVSKNEATMLCGYTEHGKLINFKAEKNLIGKLVYVKITQVKTWFAIGEYTATEDLIETIKNDPDVKRFNRLETLVLANEGYKKLLDEFFLTQKNLVILRKTTLVNALNETNRRYNELLDIISSDVLLSEYYNCLVHLNSMSKTIKEIIEGTLAEKLV